MLGVVIGTVGKRALEQQFGKTVKAIEARNKQRENGAVILTQRTLAMDARTPKSIPMSVFTEVELRYLSGGQQLGRIATVGADGTPHVVPVGWIYNAARDAIDIGGHELGQSKKFRDVARTGRAAIVIDDLESTDPWRPRGIEIRGRGEAIALPTPLIRIYPERIVSWGLEHGRSARTVTS